jgi:hypothetical protein
LKHLTFDAEDALRAMRALAEDDSATANLCAQMKAADLLSLYFDIHRVWTPPPKKRLKFLRGYRKQDARVFEKFFETENTSKRLDALAKIISLIFYKR